MSWSCNLLSESSESVTLAHWGCGFGVAIHGISIMQGLDLKLSSFTHSFVVFLVKSIILTFKGLDAEGARLYLVIFESVVADWAKPRSGRQNNPLSLILAHL
jgi:hypothetical protein